MADHLLDHVPLYLDRSLEDRIAYLRATRWIGHHGARQALERLTDLLVRPPALGHSRSDVGRALRQRQDDDRRAVRRQRIPKASESHRVWVVQTREGAGLAHFYAEHRARIPGADGKRPGRRP